MRRIAVDRTLCILFIALLVLVNVWNWDWFVPIVDARASAALGRKVTIQHLHVRLGHITTAAADGLTIGNPQGFPASEPEFVKVRRLLVQLNLFSFIGQGRVVLPLIELDRPQANIRELADGKNNYGLPAGHGGGKPPKLGELVIHDGSASVIMPSEKSDFNLYFETRQAPPDDKLFTGGEIVVDAHGTYAGAPVTGRFIGGALVSLRDRTIPYPVDLHVENGTTKASLTGTIQDPMAFAGAKLRLSFSGQNMANLYQLTGVPIPETPPFSLTGNLSYAGHSFRFTDIEGKVGSSDLEGTLTEAPGSPRRLIVADLRSRHVDLTDLAGFLGGTPGTAATPGQNAATKAKVAQAAASPNFLPHTKINLPKINIANINLIYRGEHIINHDVPLDNLVVHLKIIDGRITVDPLNFAVGTGTIASSFELTPVDGVLHTKANIDFRKLQLSRLMAATHSFAGSGTVGGSAYLTGDGNSVAEILGHGNGNAALFLQHGANVSALLVDLAGLQVGDAVLSALGIPTKTKIQCLVSDFALHDGVLDTKTFLLATKAANILGRGTVNFSSEKLNLALWTEATHFSIFSLSTPIDIGGTLKNPSVLPAAGPLAARTGSAVALGVLFPPLAILPTIRLGLGDKNACSDTIRALDSGHPHNPK